MKRNGTRLEEAENGNFGAVVYSTREHKVLYTHNDGLDLPLASAAKIAIGFAVAKWVEEEKHNWQARVNDIKLNPDEDSDILFPHLQGRTSLSLSKAVTVMIASHDNDLAHSVVNHIGGWNALNEKIKTHFPDITVTTNPRDTDNRGNIGSLFAMLKTIYSGYGQNPEVWEPIMSGMVRQQEMIEGIPKHHHAHMSGGLPTLILDIGILGVFNASPLLYILGGKNVPNRYESQEADELFSKILLDTYQEWKSQL
ncbi:MAG TPA: serine hydrolase [Bacillales bacterium]|nr:serine hydrolase [Bacillales bacterium]